MKQSKYALLRLTPLIHFTYFQFMRFTFVLLLLVTIHGLLQARILHTGHGQPYGDISTAAKHVAPGDTILVHRGNYQGNQSLGNLQGTADKWIYLLAERPGAVFIESGITAFSGTDIAWLHIEGFVFKAQTGNGVNIDDGGTYDSPSHHIVIKKCVFSNMAATGNNDLLKLSGVDDLSILACSFVNGSPGGSGIDMVGCHKSSISQCRFENMGSNAIQMKGGSSNILVEACVFKNAGSRAINLGGSTGQAFFRPADASWEASDLKVYSNIFMGSEVPVAFVGCTRSEVVNNTIYKPGKWVIRILQENRDTIHFGRCSYNTFRNNIICIDAQVRTPCSIGPGTAPETFTFSNNAWFHTANSAWPGPQLPGLDKDGLIGKDPLFLGAPSADFRIGATSPAAGAGMPLQQPGKDHTGKQFLQRRSIGAHEVIIMQEKTD
ncbi:MAG: right-handed parallel beta-helix repeat-containing protein [Bacteroidota bacterium]